jgi:hypothetical protein
MTWPRTRGSPRRAGFPHRQHSASSARTWGRSRRCGRPRGGSRWAGQRGPLGMIRPQTVLTQSPLRRHSLSPRAGAAKVLGCPSVLSLAPRSRADRNYLKSTGRKAEGRASKPLPQARPSSSVQRCATSRANNGSLSRPAVYTRLRLPARPRAGRPSFPAAPAATSETAPSPPAGTLVSVSTPAP